MELNELMFEQVINEIIFDHTIGHYFKFKPTLYKNVYIALDENCSWQPFLRIIDKDFIDNGIVVYQKITSFSGIC